MEEFKLESKSSTIGLIIRILFFSLIINRLFKLVEKIIGENSLIYWSLILITIAYLFYRYLRDKNVITIKDKKIISMSSTGFPEKTEIKEFDLDKIKKINLIQTQELIYGKKKMELIDVNDKKQTVELNLRYYQLVKLQEYIENTLKIDASLIG